VNTFFAILTCLSLSIRFFWPIPNLFSGSVFGGQVNLFRWFYLEPKQKWISEPKIKDCIQHDILLSLGEHGIER
jgi:hypothetical protein